MHIQVTRKIYTDTTTISEFLIDGKFYCHVLEDVTRATWETKVWGKTAIPAGTYNVTITDSPKFGRKLPLLEGVPGFSGVRIHTGNKPEDTEGCLLPGTYDPKTPDWVSGSKAAFDKIFPLMWAAQVKRQEITITIVDTKVFEKPKPAEKEPKKVKK